MGLKWEYITKDATDMDLLRNYRFNDLGEEGWELVAIQGNEAFFKRPLSEVMVRRCDSVLRSTEKVDIRCEKEEGHEDVHSHGCGAVWL